MQTRTFTDTHVHLDFSELADDLKALLEQCTLQRVNRLIVPTVAPNNWQKALALKPNRENNNPLIYCALGIHPWYLKGLSEQHLVELDNLINVTLSKPNNIVALGEMGLDGVIAKEENNLEQQISFFEHQLKLTNKYQLPAIIHHRRTHEQTLILLKQHTPTKGGIIHAFSGSYQQAIRYIDLGFKLGIGGTITYSRAKKTINAIKRLPKESLVLETDAPAMPLDGQQGKANTPLNVVEVFNHLSQIRHESTDELAMQLEQNVNELFEFK